VAGEVRLLAQRSAEAAKEIKGLIGASVEKVEHGAKLVQDAGQTMSELVGSVRRVSDIIGEITAGAAEQRDGIDQVNRAVAQLDQMTQQNAALVEESAAAADSMKHQAGRLSELVSTFRLGSDTAPPSSHAPPPAAHEIAARRVIQAAAAKPAPRNLPTPAAPADSDWESF
jgi:methyl-accepting chemotaxis protein